MIDKVRSWFAAFWRELFPDVSAAKIKKRRKRKGPREKDEFGKAGEALAVSFLRKKRYEILAQNVSMPGGELDIVAKKGDCHVFIEVKTRKTDASGDPIFAVHDKKRKTIARLAEMFMRYNKLSDRPFRCDVIAIVWPDGEEPRIEHFENAFDAFGNPL